jgi:hypothetical protein
MVTGGVTLVMIVVIMLSFVGVFDASPALQLSWGLVGFVSTILFARFGGFKPFFASHPDPPRLVARTIPQQASEGLVSVSAATNETVRVHRLFENRQPFETASPATEAVIDEHSTEDLLEVEDAGLADTSPIFDVEIDEAGIDKRSPEGLLGVAPIFDEETDKAGIDDDSDESLAHPIFEEEDEEALRRIYAGFMRSSITPVGRDAPAAPIFDEEQEDRRVQLGLLRNPIEPDTDEPGVPIFPGGERSTGTVRGEASDLNTASLPGAAANNGVGSSVITAPARHDITAVASGSPAVELLKYSSSEIAAVVKEQESALVDTLIDEGLLTTDGPITDRDVRTMVFVAVSSTELVDVLTSTHDEERPFVPPPPAELDEGGAD